MEAIEALTKRVPAHNVVTFAEVARGGTGRCDLVVHTVAGELVPVVHQLSRGQAETAAGVINNELGRHFDDQAEPGPIREEIFHRLAAARSTIDAVRARLLAFEAGEIDEPDLIGAIRDIVDP